MAITPGALHGALTLSPQGEELPLDVTVESVDREIVKVKGTAYDGPFTYEGRIDAKGARFLTKPDSGAPERKRR